MRSTKEKFVSTIFLFHAIWISGCQSSAIGNGVNGSTLDPPASSTPQLTAGLVSATLNPQVARYTIVPPRSGSVTVEFGPDTNYGLQTAPSRQFSVLVAGMRAFTTYHMRARMDFDDGTQMFDSDHTFTTGGLPPERVPKTTVTRPSGMTPNPGIELIDVANLTPIANTAPVGTAAVDLNGNLIWYYDMQDGTHLDSAFPVKLLPTGNFLMVVNGFSSGYRVINLAGEIVSQGSLEAINLSLAQAGIPISVDSLHHDILPMPNGHLILLATVHKEFTDLPGLPGTTKIFGDALIDLDENLKAVWGWSAFDHLDVNRHPLGLPDWTHANAVIYSPDDGNLIFSMRNQSWVIKINYQDGRGDGSIVWRLGFGGDFGIPGGGPADFNYAQHFPVVVGPKSAGVFQLMLFDNGNNRITDSSGTMCGFPGAPACYSRPVIFQLDETSKTAQIVWEHKLPIFSPCCGSINILENGNVEYDIAAAAVTPTFSSKIQEVTLDPVNPQLVWQMDLTGQLGYRVFRIPSLYPGVEWKNIP
jgi:arylsulfate sulfotransferase